MNGIVAATPRCMFEHAIEPSPCFTEISLAGERPPCEGASKSGERKSPAAERLNRERASAYANEEPGNRQPFACAVPSAAFPDTDWLAMGREVQVLVGEMAVSHDPDLHAISGHTLETAALIGFFTPSVTRQTVGPAPFLL